MSEVAAIVPVKNGAPFLHECLGSLLDQVFAEFQVVVFDDGSCDETQEIIRFFSTKFAHKGIDFRHDRSEISGGVGYAKDRAIKLSDAHFLCFCDADDVSLPNRLSTLYRDCLKMPEPENVLIGSNFRRSPDDSTSRYTKWACNLKEFDLYNQIYTAFGPTLVAPTWFMSRKLYEKVGGFNINIKSGFPEDLDIFYRVIDAGAKLHKIEDCLVIYRYHVGCATFGVDEHTIWNIRINELQRNVLRDWPRFTIWNAGRQGRRFYKSIDEEFRRRVIAFIDVDEKKLLSGSYNIYDEKQKKVVTSIPIIPFSAAKPPVIICVKLDMTNGNFEKYLSETGWKEGIDYFHFS